MDSPAEREKTLIEELVSFVPYGPTAPELWADKVDLECTGCDDHDLENCEKCWRLRRRIVQVLRAALKQEREQCAQLLERRAAELEPLEGKPVMAAWKHGFLMGLASWIRTEP